MAGSYMLPHALWVFMLCTAFSIITCEPCEGRMPFKDFKFKDEYVVGDETIHGVTSHLCLVRWCHRITPPALLDQHRAYPNVDPEQLVDPLATQFGCERIVWARRGEVAAERAGDLQRSMARELKQIDLSNGTEAATIRKGSSNNSKKSSSAGRKRSRCSDVSAARSLLDNFCNRKYRADDAFAGRAYCAVQSTRVAATPVAVQPVFHTARRDIWDPAQCGYHATGDYREFTGSQGHRLSAYHQLRLNVFSQPKDA